MFGECHAHIALDGIDYRASIKRHEERVDEESLRRHFLAYQQRGISFVRDGGDNVGASLRAKALAPDFGIDYRTPAFAIHKNGHYGSIVGKGFSTLKEYALLVEEAKAQGADFIKIMTTGILDFNKFGSIIMGPALTAGEVYQMVHIAHESGLAVASHTNGADSILAAIEAGVDSIEHGNYLNEECLETLVETRTILVPTAAVAYGKRGQLPYEQLELEKIIEATREAIARAVSARVTLALGSDAGAQGVMHGQGLLDEYAFLAQCVPDTKVLDELLEAGERSIKETFKM